MFESRSLQSVFTYFSQQDVVVELGGYRHTQTPRTQKYTAF